MQKSKKNGPPEAGASSLLLDLVVRPRRALDRIEAPGSALESSAAVYLAVLAASVLFYTFKPADFPPIPEGTAAMRFSGGLGFWTAVFAWNALQTAVIAAMAAWYARLLAEGRLPARLGLGALSVVAPLLLLIVYLSVKRLNSGWPLVAWAALIALLRPNFRRVPRERWRPVLSLFMACNGVLLAALPLTLALTALRADRAYLALEIAKSLWILGLASYGMSRLAGLPPPRAVAAVVLSLLFSLVFFSSMYLYGVLPKTAVIGLLAV